SGVCVGMAAAGQNEIQGHPGLAAPRKEPRADEGSEPRRRQELEALGKRVQAPAEGDVGAAEAVVGADEPAFDAEPPTERQRPRLLREEGIAAALDSKPVS